MDNEMTIAYQGTPGSYSQQLLDTIFPNSLYQPCETFSSLIAFASKLGNFGLLPVENSIAGTVNEAYEELIESSLSIYGEYIKKINHSLIALPESRLELITNVISHPQALQQCSKYLQEHNYKITPVFDTAGSVYEVLRTNDNTTAAIAGEHFDSDGRFKILEKNISNDSENFTRFLFIGLEPPNLSLINNKFSSVLISDDKPGSLLKSLNIFNDLNINLTKLESRPILGRPWEYKFYIDYELSDLSIQHELLERIGSVSKEFKILGHYPKANQ
jgi:prephenate dehydratase|tara:strand:+ start:6997 stop:7818 length:822 start_codon:yes stop_codon:yes gene_type:complete